MVKYFFSLFANHLNWFKTTKNWMDKCIKNSYSSNYLYFLNLFFDLTKEQIKCRTSVCFIHAICQYKNKAFKFPTGRHKKSKIYFSCWSFSLIVSLIPSSSASRCWIERFHLRRWLSGLSGFFIFWNLNILWRFWKKWTTLTWGCVSFGRRCCRRCRCSRRCCCGSGGGWGRHEVGGGVF